MTASTKPTRFLHTPGFNHTTYLIADTIEGRELAARTPEHSVRLTRQHLASRAHRPLAFASLVGAGAAGGSAIGPFIGGATVPGLTLGGIIAFIVLNLASMACNVYSTLGHAYQEHQLNHAHRDIAQPLKWRESILSDLPLTIRGVPTLTMLSRAADAGAMGAVYLELSLPGRTHSPGVEEILDALANPDQE